MAWYGRLPSRWKVPTAAAVTVVVAAIAACMAEQSHRARFLLAMAMVTAAVAVADVSPHSRRTPQAWAAAVVVAAPVAA